MFNLDGVAVAAITPFNEEGDLDEPASRTLIDWWLSQGVHGLVACGSTGEAAYLNHSERQRLFEIAVEQTKGRVPVVAGTGFASTRETIEMTQTAAAIGADAALVVTSYYYPVDQRALFEHYQKVAASSKIPILLYNNPQVTHITLAAETVAQLSQVENIVGIKDSAGDWAQFERILELTGDDFIVLSGSLKLLPVALPAGADGAILAIASLAPALCAQLYQLYQEARTKEAQALHGRLKALSHAVYEAYGIAGLKAAMKFLGLPSGFPRSPLRVLSASEEQILQKILQQLNLAHRRD